MKLPILAAAAFVASMGTAFAQWGPPGYPPPPPPPGYGWRPPPGYGYRPPPPPPYYGGPRYRSRDMVRRCWWREGRYGPRRVCGWAPRRY